MPESFTSIERYRLSSGQVQSGGREEWNISMNKISVIIPMYNSETYIEQCIKSVMNQTYQDFEVLIIDDGSTDCSLKICKEFSLTDDRLKVYHQKNRGVSAARNYGLDIAAGEYVFFLDSDDAIHPFLLEEMIRQTEKFHAQMVFCDCAKIDGQSMETVLQDAQIKSERPQWQIADGAEAERWFHIDYRIELSRISGIVGRDCIGALRFDEKLVNGEDTLFMYHLFCRQVRTAYSPCQWYYYRMHEDSVSHAKETLIGETYCESSMRIRDSEHRKGRFEYALKWETAAVIQLREKYEVCRTAKDKARGDMVKEVAFRERKHPLFQSLNPVQKILFRLCFKCHPVYLPLRKIVSRIWEIAETHRKKTVLKAMASGRESR